MVEVFALQYLLEWRKLAEWRILINLLQHEANFCSRCFAARLVLVTSDSWLLRAKDDFVRHLVDHLHRGSDIADEGGRSLDWQASLVRIAIEAPRARFLMHVLVQKHQARNALRLNLVGVATNERCLVLLLSGRLMGTGKAIQVIAFHLLSLIDAVHLRVEFRVSRGLMLHRLLN